MREEIQAIIDRLDAALERGQGVVTGNDLIEVRTGLVVLRDEVLNEVPC